MINKIRSVFGILAEKNTLLKSVSIVFSSKMIAQLIGTITAIIIGRHIGAQLYGSYSYVMALIGILSVLTTLGMDNSILFLFSKYQNETKKRNGLLTFCIFFTMLLSVLVVAFIEVDHLSLSNLIKSAYHAKLKILIPLVIVLSLNKIYYSVFRTLLNIKFITTVSNIVLPTARLLVILVLIFIGCRDVALEVSIYIAVLITFVLYTFHFLKIDYFKFEKPERSIVHETVAYSLPLFISEAMIIILARMDMLFIGSMMDQKSVGIYSIVFKVVVLLTFINRSVATVYTPMISKYFSKGELPLLTRQYKKVSFVVFFATLFIFGYLAVFRVEVLSLFGIEFVIGSTALFLLMLGQVVNSYASLAEKMNSMTGHPEYAMYGGVLALTTNGILNYLFIPIMGMAGAALASTITMLLRSVFHQIMVYKTLKIGNFSFEYIKSVVVLVATTTLIIVLKNVVPNANPIANLFIGGVIYVGIFLGISYVFFDVNQYVKIS